MGRFQVIGLPWRPLAAALQAEAHFFRFDLKLPASPHALVPHICSIRISQAFSLPLQGFRSCWPPAHMRYTLQRPASQGTSLPSSNCHKATWRKLPSGRDEAKSCAGKHGYCSIIAPRSCNLMLHHHASTARRSAVCKRLSCAARGKLPVAPHYLSASDDGKRLKLFNVRPLTDASAATSCLWPSTQRPRD